jgi:hypothetical protein
MVVLYYVCSILMSLGAVSVPERRSNNWHRPYGGLACVSIVEARQKLLELRFLQPTGGM